MSCGGLGVDEEAIVDNLTNTSGVERENRAVANSVLTQSRYSKRGSVFQSRAGSVF